METAQAPTPVAHTPQVAQPGLKSIGPMNLQDYDTLPADRDHFNRVVKDRLIAKLEESSDRLLYLECHYNGDMNFQVGPSQFRPLRGSHPDPKQIGLPGAELVPSRYRIDKRQINHPEFPPELGRMMLAYMDREATNRNLGPDEVPVPHRTVLLPNGNRVVPIVCGTREDFIGGQLDASFRVPVMQTAIPVPQGKPGRAARPRHQPQAQVDLTVTEETPTPSQEASE